MESKTTQLDSMRTVLRLKHMSIRTENTSVNWAQRSILFHKKRHPRDMGAWTWPHETSPVLSSSVEIC